MLVGRPAESYGGRDDTRGVRGLTEREDVSLPGICYGAQGSAKTMLDAFFETHGHRLPRDVGAFLDDVLVECPRCGKLAHVLVGKPFYGRPTTLVCGGCGYNAAARSVLPWHETYRRGLDPFFGLPLWLREPVERDVVWAYNWRHFEDLGFFLDGDWKAHRHNLALPNYHSTWSYRTRLPKWMQQKGNRAAILKAMTRIQRRRLQDWKST